MLDFSHVPTQQKANIDYFYTLNASNEWQVWNKPRNITMVNMFCMAGGGGGGCGSNTTNTSDRGGGGGGGSGSISNFLIPAFLLPDVLYVQVGRGGSGGLGGTVDYSNGASGGNSIISLSSTGASNTNILYSTGGRGGQRGRAAVAGSGLGGAGGVAIVTSGNSVPYITLGIYYDTAGTDGAHGGNTSTGNNVAYSTTAINCGGAGGAGGGGTGGVSGGLIYNIPLSFSNLAGGLANSAGNSGYFTTNPLISVGGSGGGSAGGASAAGGSGGIGSYGSGGGGGGAGGTTGRGGSGGAGGPGIVIITSW